MIPIRIRMGDIHVALLNVYVLVCLFFCTLLEKKSCEHIDRNRYVSTYPTLSSRCDSNSMC